MKFFSKNEIKAVSIILLLIAIVSFFNFRIAFRRARDNQRKNDLGTFQSALDKYQNDLGVLPPNSYDGKIVACKGEDTYFDEKAQVWVNMVPCNWGKDSLTDFSDPKFTPYLSTLPDDPLSSKGILYNYISNGSSFQLFVYLEGKDEAEYDPKIEARGIKCGIKVCNCGRSSGNAGVYKTLEEYENEQKK